MACSLADGFKALTDLGITAGRIILVGGGARSQAMQRVIAAVFGLPVSVPEPGEYVAGGAARQAAGVLLGALPSWKNTTALIQHDPTPEVLQRYRAATAISS